MSSQVLFQPGIKYHLLVKSKKSLTEREGIWAGFSGRNHLFFARNEFGNPTIYRISDKAWKNISENSNEPQIEVFRSTKYLRCPEKEYVEQLLQIRGISKC